MSPKASSPRTALAYLLPSVEPAGYCHPPAANMRFRQVVPVSLTLCRVTEQVSLLCLATFQMSGTQFSTYNCIHAIGLEEENPRGDWKWDEV